MESHHKQQVVFIARTIWGGGVEKVLYELAHGLNRELFEPTVIYLLNEKTLIDYDPAIRTICLQTIIDGYLPHSPPNASVLKVPPPITKEPPAATIEKPVHKSTASRLLHSIYYILPGSIREKLHFRQRLQSISLASSSIKHQTVHFVQNYYNVLSPSVREKIHIRQRLRFLKYRKNRLTPDEQQLTVKPRQTNEFPGVFFVVPRYIPEQYDITNTISELWFQVLGLRKVLEGFSQDAILIPTDEYNTVLLWLSQLPPYRKVIASQHYPYSQAQSIRYPDERVRRVKEWAYLNACRAADLVTFDSEGSRQDFIKHYGASHRRTIFMPNLIHCDLILQKAREPLNIELHKINKRTIFTQVARLSLEKNPQLLIDACSILLKKYDDFVVLFVGDGPLFSEMVRQIAKKKLYDHILMLGEQSNPYPHMAAARALLLTSRSESSPLVLVESMLCGAVPIATDCIAGPRELLADGKLGLLVPPGDPEAFAKAMLQIAKDDDLYYQLRKNAREHAMRFDVPRVVKEWEDLILKVAKGQVDDYSV